MIYRWIGAVLIVAGCGGFGFSMAAEHRRQEKLLSDFRQALKAMKWELQFRLTPLPDLCTMAGKQVGGSVGRILCGVSRELQQQVYPEVSGCVEKVLSEGEELPRFVRGLFRRLGTSLGRYDLAGQVEGLEELLQICKREDHRLRSGREQRLKSYRTLSLCTGAALAILFV